MDFISEIGEYCKYVMFFEQSKLQTISYKTCFVSIVTQIMYQQHCNFVILFLCRQKNKYQKDNAPLIPIHAASIMETSLITISEITDQNQSPSA